MIRISIKWGYTTLLILQAAVVGVCAFFLIRIYYHNNTSLQYSHTSTVLDLYMLNCENKLEMIEKGSFNILSDQTMQKELEVVENGMAVSYDDYLARQQIERLLMNYLFAIEHCTSISFIANDSTQLVGSYSSSDRLFTQDEIQRLRDIAEPYEGGTVWVRSTDGQNLHMLRIIKEVNSGKFRNLGVLVLTCPVKAIFNYVFPYEYAYSPVMVVEDGQGGLYFSKGSTFLELNTLEKVTDSFVVIDATRYYTTNRISTHTGWLYTCYISNADLLRGINILNTQIIVALAVVLAFSLVAALKFSFSVTSRIECLSMEMDAMRVGKYQFLEEERGTLQVREVEALNHNFHYMVEEIDHLINDVYRKQIMIRDMRYKVLRGQINPHFLNNTLDTINSLAKQREQAEISLMVQSLSKMLRAALDDLDLHPLKEELGLLNSYLTIQKIRFEERLDFSMENMEPYADILIPKLTLQPLIENSIKYGLEKYAKICIIRVGAEILENNLCIWVSDNGPGMTHEFLERVFSGEIESKSSGLGIQNIHERVRLAFGEDYGIFFDSVLGEGTTANVIIPLKAEDGRDGSALYNNDLRR